MNINEQNPIDVALNNNYENENEITPYKMKDISPSKDKEQLENKENNEDNLTTYQFTSVKDQLNYALAPGRKQFVYEEFISFMGTRRIISINEINSAPILCLKEQESETPQYMLQNEVIINAGGLINGNRNVRDGIVVFCKKEIQRNPSFICDYELGFTDDLFYLPYVFVIFYSQNCFYISPHQSKGYDNYLPLIQLSRELNILIKDREIFSIGSVTLLICTNSNGGIEITNVGILNENAENKPTIWSFDKSKLEITIGKGKNCDISFAEDKVLSRVHCTLCYDRSNWIMKDGYNQKSSTNGTFLFCLKSFRIIDNMSIRILSSDIIFTLKTPYKH